MLLYAVIHYRRYRASKGCLTDLWAKGRGSYANRFSLWPYIRLTPQQMQKDPANLTWIDWPSRFVSNGKHLRIAAALLSPKVWAASCLWTHAQMIVDLDYVYRRRGWCLRCHGISVAMRLYCSDGFVIGRCGSSRCGRMLEA